MRDARAGHSGICVRQDNSDPRRPLEQMHEPCERESATATSARSGPLSLYLISGVSLRFARCSPVMVWIGPVRAENLKRVGGPWPSSRCRISRENSLGLFEIDDLAVESELVKVTAGSFDSDGGIEAAG